MKKLFKVIVICMMTIFLMACNKSVSCKFDVSTGDSVVIKLNTNSGYVLAQEEGTFSVSDSEKNIVLQGFFVTEDMYKAYLDAVETSGATIIEESKGNGCSYLQYQLVSETHTENNFICWLDGSSTGIVIASVAEQEDAEGAFDLLSFSY